MSQLAFSQCLFDVLRVDSSAAANEQFPASAAAAAASPADLKLHVFSPSPAAIAASPERERCLTYPHWLHRLFVASNLPVSSGECKESLAERLKSLLTVVSRSFAVAEFVLNVCDDREWM